MYILISGEVYSCYSWEKKRQESQWMDSIPVKEQDDASCQQGYNVFIWLEVYKTTDLVVSGRLD